jgi:hypothetical protein
VHSPAELSSIAFKFIWAVFPHELAHSQLRKLS